jgi:hypothetical protein
MKCLRELHHIMQVNVHMCSILASAMLCQGGEENCPSRRRLRLSTRLLAASKAALHQLVSNLA